MIWTKKQLIKNLIKHIVNGNDMVYYVREYISFYDNIERYDISYKPIKGSTKIRTVYGYNYWMENFREYVNDSLDYDIYEIEQDDSLTEKQKEIEKCNKYSEKRLDDTEEFKDYLYEAISNIFNTKEDIDI